MLCDICTFGKVVHSVSQFERKVDLRAQTKAFCIIYVTVVEISRLFIK